jgi:hypothetical protein
MVQVLHLNGDSEVEKGKKVLEFNPLVFWSFLRLHARSFFDILSAFLGQSRNIFPVR